jgi:hypothetical protein
MKPSSPSPKSSHKEKFSAVQKKGVNISMRDVLLECFVGLGGTPALQAWAEENKTEYYKLLAKHTIPTRMEVGGLDGEKIQLEMINATESARRKLGSAIEREGGQNLPRVTH